ncbi:MAG: hypothetical protein Q7T24_07990, partial [Deltaproteobacteria bacterium]|nr:hypothetical protein [Deltaproteobacteria bacterium]
LYRIGGVEEFYSAGLQEFVYGKGISVIEWADKVLGLLDDCAVVIRFTYMNESEREIEIDEKRLNSRKGSAGQ